MANSGLPSRMFAADEDHSNGCRVRHRQAFRKRRASTSVLLQLSKSGNHDRRPERFWFLSVMLVGRCASGVCNGLSLTASG